MLLLKVYDGQEKIREVELASGTVSIGREPENTVVLPDVSVSRRHAQIEPNGNFFLLRDNGSTNGTFVNEMLARAQVLGHGDVIRIGKYVLRVEKKRNKAHETTRVRVETLRLPGRSHRGGLPQRGDIAFEGDRSLVDASRERLLRVYEIQREIGYIDKREDLLERALEIILAELHADRGSVLLSEIPWGGVAVEELKLVPAAVRTRPEILPALGPDPELVLPQEILLEATIRQGGSLKAAEPGTGQLTIASMACALRERKSLRGVVYVERLLSGAPFSGEDLQFLSAIAGQVAISLANAELFEEVALQREKFRGILTSLTDGIIVTDRTFRVVDANAASAVILGTEGRAVLGVDLFELFAGYKLSPAPELLRRACLKEGAIFHLSPRLDDGGGQGSGASIASTGEGSGQASLEGATTHPPSPGAARHPSHRTVVAGRVLPFPRDRAEPEGLLVLLRDRSETHRLEELKTNFIGNVAHKLRTPLTVIQGSLPFLKEAMQSDGSIQEILEEVERNSRALCLLIDQFIELTELEVQSIRHPASAHPLKLQHLLKEVAASLAGEAAPKGIRIAERVPEGPLLVEGRRDCLAKAFRHVLENAVKFSPEGGQIRVEAEARDGFVQVDCVDHGPGIPPGEIESVFYVCHQVDEERTGQVPGAGLGLTMARHIVQEHGGEVEIESPYGFADHGTRVSVRLPLAGALSLKEET